MPRILRRFGGEDSSARRATSGVSDFQLAPHDVAFFETFGFLLLPGLFTEEMPRIREGFEEVFAREEAQTLDPANKLHRTSDPRYRRETRSIIPAFIDRSEKLGWLRSDPRVTAIARALLGDDYRYAESDGNLFNCDVHWHLDAYGAAADALHIKVFFYLDALRRDAGALRVIPGSQFNGAYLASLFRQVTKEPERIPENLGVGIDEIPAWTLETEPGDVIVTNFRTLHASFNGRARRRLFTVNFRAAADDRA